MLLWDAQQTWFGAGPLRLMTERACRTRATAITEYPESTGPAIGADLLLVRIGSGRLSGTSPGAADRQERPRIPHIQRVHCAPPPGEHGQ